MVESIFFRPCLGSNCLQKLPADDTSRKLVIGINAAVP